MWPTPAGEPDVARGHQAYCPSTPAVGEANVIAGPAISFPLSCIKMLGMTRPGLHVAEVFVWADAYHAKWKWRPNQDSGPVDGQDRVTWCGIALEPPPCRFGLNASRQLRKGCGRTGPRV